MPIRWDTPNKRWRFEFDRHIGGHRYRLSRLLPRGWSQTQADTYDRQEGARLYAIASGVEQRDPLIDEAVALYLRDKKHLKSYKATAEHLAAIAWAYMGRPISALSAVADEVQATAETAPATVRNRLACLKAAARWAWKKHNLTAADPTTRMQLPAVRNERHVYASRLQMLQICRACKNWQAQVAIRVAFYTGMRLGELYTAAPGDGMLVLHNVF
jgi:integrase